MEDEVDIRGRLARTRQLLAMEQKAEVEAYEEATKGRTPKEAEQLGVALLNLSLKSTKGGLYGRTVLAFTHFNYNKTKNLPLLPASKFKPGDLVFVKEKNGDKTLFPGTVSEMKPHKIKVAVDVEDEALEGLLSQNFYSIYVGINDVTYRRYESALRLIGENPQKVKQMLSVEEREVKVAGWYDKSLNQSQRKAVQEGLNHGRISLIHGPPGTGKTKTVCELIAQAVANRMKVLACAPSNIAVDNLVQRLLKFSHVKPLRLGNPTRMLQTVLRCCLDSQLQEGEFAKTIKDSRQEYNKLLRRLDKEEGRDNRKRLRGEIRRIKGELREFEQLNQQEILRESNVVLATCVGAADRALQGIQFDLVVVDECAQAIQVATWLPLLRGRKAVLAGDNQQLPPTVKAPACKQLSVTLFDRLLRKAQCHSSFLDQQYRMNPLIMQWSNAQFYGGRLNSADSVLGITLADLCKSEQPVLQFLNTEGYGLLEQSEQLSLSKLNRGEALLTVQVLRELEKAGLPPSKITVITPYNGQVALLRSLLPESDVQISTVDSIQGRENECIVISMVRANRVREVGFLSDFRRMNVAVTRAKRALIVIAHKPTVTHDPYIKALLEHLEQQGTSLEVQQLIDAEILRSQFPLRDQHPVVPLGEAGAKQEKEKKAKKKKPKKKKEELKIEQKNQEAGKTVAVERQPKADDQQLKEQRKAREESQYLQLQQRFSLLLQQFKSSDSQKLLVENLNANERRVLHEQCDRLRLQHESQGAGKGVKSVLVSKAKEVAQKGAHQQKQKAKKPKKKKPKIKQQQPEEVDQLAVEQAIKPEGLCAFGQCLAKTNNYIGIPCKYCEKKYCGGHRLAEDHGCGDICREEARQKFRQEFKQDDGQARARLAARLEEDRLKRGKKMKPQK